MSFEPREYLQHILVEAEYLLEQSRSLGKAEFLQHETLRRAFVRSLEIIGEAAKRVPDDVRVDHPASLAMPRTRVPPIPWEAIPADVPSGGFVE